MPRRMPIVNRLDRRRLLDLLAADRPAPTAERLREVLDAAYVVPPHQVPDDLVTMNSIVRLWNPRTGARTVYTLVYPYDAPRTERGLSIFSPLGAALFARRVGYPVDTPTDDDTADAVIEALEYQPERAGHFDR